MIVRMMTLLSRGKLSFRQRDEFLARAVRWRGGRKTQKRREETADALAILVFFDLLAAVGVGRGLQLVDLRSILCCVEEVESTAVCKNASV